MSARVCSPPVLLMDLNPTRRLSLSPDDPSPSMSSSSAYFFPTSSSSSSDFSVSRSSASNITTLTHEIMDRLPSRRVSVNLFGTPHGSVEYARNKLKELQKRDSERWNYDFNNDQPLEGRYKWEIVRSGVESRIPIPTPSSTSSTVQKSASVCPSTSTSTSPPESKFSIPSTSIPQTGKILEEPLLIVTTEIISHPSQPQPSTSTSTPISIPRPTPSRKRPAPATESIPSPKPPIIISTRSSVSSDPTKVPTTTVPVISRVMEPTENEQIGRKYLKTDSCRHVRQQKRIVDMFPQTKASLQKRVPRRQNTVPARSSTAL